MNNVAVTGDLTMVRRGNGAWEAEGCIGGALNGTQTSALNPTGGNRGLTGAIEARACFGAETTLSLRIGAWKPIPSVDFTVPNTEMVYQTTADGWKLTAQAGPLTSFSVGTGNNPLSITNVYFTGTLTNTNTASTWTVGVRGTATFGLLGQQEQTLNLVGSYDSATAKLAIAATWDGEIHLLGRDDLKIVDPVVEVSVTLGSGAGDVEIRLTAPFSVTVRGTTLTGTISGGGSLGNDAGFWFAGSLAPATSLQIPGFAPINGSLCVAVASGEVAKQQICPGIESALTQGVRLMLKTDLPVKFSDPASPVLLSVILEPSGKLTLEAELDINWFIIRPGNGFGGIEWMKVDSLSFFATIDGDNTSFGFEGLVEFQPSPPSGQSAAATPTIVGVVQMSFNLTPSLTVLMYIDGRWYEPFGIDGIAIENPGFLIAMKLSTVPPVPSSIGVNMDFFWKRTGAWPAFVETPDSCATLPCNTPEPDCKDHLKCQIEQSGYDISQIGGTVFIDTEVTPSGFCFGGACAPLPTYIFRLDVGELALSDVVNLLLKPFNVLLERLQNQLAGILPASLANLSLPEMPPDVGLDIHTLHIVASTHNKSVFGYPFTAGFRTLLDIDVGSTRVFFDGYLGTKGVSAEGSIAPFTLLGQQFEGDPFAKYARPGAGFVQVAHESKLDFFANGGTIEGWVQKDTALSLPATFASKLTATTGWAITIDQPDMCIDGSCPPRSRVVITARSGGVTRTVRTREGAIAPSTRNHLAVIWRPTPQTFEVRVNGVSLDLEEMNTPALTTGPASSSSALRLGQGLALIDDVRLWNVPLSADDIQGRSRILDPGFPKWTELVARWEFDFDKPAIAYNSRWYAGSDGQTMTKLHGVHLSGSAPIDDPADQDLYARLSLRVDQPAETGVFAAVGTTVKIPVLVPDGMSARGRVRLGRGQMFAEAYVRNFEMLKLGNLGAFVIGGYGQNLEAGDFDDGVYARLQLKPDFALDINASLGWGSLASSRLIGTATLGANSGHVWASGSLNLTIPVPLIGTTGLTGDFDFDTDRGMDINGNVVVAGRNLVSSGIYVDRDKLRVTASTNLGTVFGFNLGGPNISFTLNWSTGDFCGAFGWGDGSVNCTIGVCIGASGLDFDFDCGGISPCDVDGDCVASEFCMLGAWCKGDYQNGWGPCNRSAQCQSGACGALFGSQCYQPHTKARDELCFADDQCVEGLVCVDILGIGRCRSILGYNDWGCESSSECQAGLSCLDVGMSHRCLHANLTYGSSCQRDEECSSGRCHRGSCECNSDGHCPQGYYCDDHECRDRGQCSANSDCPSGKSCTYQMSGAWVCNPTNWSPQGGPCFSQSDCQASAAITSPFCFPLNQYAGVCACIGDAMCGAGYRCDVESKTCVPKLGTYSICTRDDDCATGLCALLSWKITDHWNFVQAHGSPPSPHKYWPEFASCSPRATVAIGDTCYTNEECNRGLCTTSTPHVCVCDGRDDCAAPLGKQCSFHALVDRPTSTPYNPNGPGCANDCECANDSKCVAPLPPVGNGSLSGHINSSAPGRCQPLEAGETNACTSCQQCTNPATCARPGTPTNPRMTVCQRDTECPASWRCGSAFSVYESSFNVCRPQSCLGSNQCDSGLQCRPSPNIKPSGSYCLP